MTIIDIFSEFFFQSVFSLFISLYFPSFSPKNVRAADAHMETRISPQNTKMRRYSEAYGIPELENEYPDVWCDHLTCFLMSQREPEQFNDWSCPKSDENDHTKSSDSEAQNNESSSSSSSTTSENSNSNSASSSSNHLDFKHIKSKPNPAHHAVFDLPIDMRDNYSKKKIDIQVRTDISLSQLFIKCGTGLPYCGEQRVSEFPRYMYENAELADIVDEEPAFWNVEKFVKREHYMQYGPASHEDYMRFKYSKENIKRRRISPSNSFTNAPDSLTVSAVAKNETYVVEKFPLANATPLSKSPHVLFVKNYLSRQEFGIASNPRNYNRLYDRNYTDYYYWAFSKGDMEFVVYSAALFENLLSIFDPDLYPRCNSGSKKGTTENDRNRKREMIIVSPMNPLSSNKNDFGEEIPHSTQYTIVDGAHRAAILLEKKYKGDDSVKIPMLVLDTPPDSPLITRDESSMEEILGKYVAELNEEQTFERNFKEQFESRGREFKGTTSAWWDADM